MSVFFIFTKTAMELFILQTHHNVLTLQRAFRSLSLLFTKNSDVTSLLRNSIIRIITLTLEEYSEKAKHKQRKQKDRC